MVGVACVTPKTVFVCVTGADCAGGSCEPTGYCSVDDAGCESGRRYVEYSGTWSNMCVPADLGPCEIAAIGVGNHLACAVRSSDQTVWCWGSNYDGRLGNSFSGGGTIEPTPFRAAGRPITDAVEIAGGGQHTCVR